MVCETLKRVMSWGHLGSKHPTQVPLVAISKFQVAFLPCKGVFIDRERVESRGSTQFINQALEVKREQGSPKP